MAERLRLGRPYRRSGITGGNKQRRQNKHDLCSVDHEQPLAALALRYCCLPPHYIYTRLRQMRDLRSVGAKLKIVLNPRGDQDGVLTKLKDCECAASAADGRLLSSLSLPLPQNPFFGCELCRFSWHPEGTIYYSLAGRAPGEVISWLNEFSSTFSCPLLPPPFSRFFFFFCQGTCGDR